MKKSIRTEGADKLQEMADELRLRQSNVLPPDVISNDRSVDDVLWNGPASRPLVQRVGAFVIGFMLFSFNLAAASVFYEKGARLFLFPFVLIAVAGLRVIYMSIKGRTVRKTS
jgi:hypothetical protein